ncbi:hypothetical protein, partial [Synechococcus sp. R55.2]|uniref:hypothetical protein n=1 Tax=Synechococcus sp. R55.2 TaxID=2964496 RepID=UPI0039C4A82B
LLEVENQHIALQSDRKRGAVSSHGWLLPTGQPLGQSDQRSKDKKARHEQIFRVSSAAFPDGLRTI